MKKLKAFLRVLGVLALLLVALNLMVSPTAAVGTRSRQQSVGPQDEGDAVPGGPGFVILNGYDFKPYYATDTWQYDGAALFDPSTAFEYFIAPVHLSQGATINQMVVYFYDNESSGLFQVELKQFSNINSSVIYMAGVYPVAGSPNNLYLATSSIAWPVVDNSLYSYAVAAQLPGELLGGLYAVRIDYGYTTSLPLVVK